MSTLSKKIFDPPKLTGQRGGRVFDNRKVANQIKPRLHQYQIWHKNDRVKANTFRQRERESVDLRGAANKIKNSFDNHSYQVLHFYAGFFH